MKDLEGSRTHENLRQAFAAESQANRRLLHFARAADLEGRTEVGGLFREAAEAQTGRAFALLGFLAGAGDPMTGLPLGDTRRHLEAALSSARRGAGELYPAMAATARAEGYPEVAAFFDALTSAERTLADRLEQAL